MVPGSDPSDARRGRARGLVGRHAARDDRGCPVLSLDDHHRRLDAGDLQRGVEDAVHELLEVDRASELAEQPVSPALQLRPLECAGELSGQLVHLAPHLVDRADELVVRRSACAAADDS